MNFLSIILIGMPGGAEWIIVILCLLLLFGGRKIPELMKGFGRGIKEFKNATKEEDKSSEKETKT